jgi:coenzyme F420-reducing hydrogenase delta subunit
VKHIYYFSAAIAVLAAGSANAAETQKYRYDAKGRLIKVERTGTVNNGVTSEYTHDKANNRIRVKTTGSANIPPP